MATLSQLPSPKAYAERLKRRRQAAVQAVQRPMVEAVARIEALKAEAGSSQAEILDKLAQVLEAATRPVEALNADELADAQGPIKEQLAYLTEYLAAIEARLAELPRYMNQQPVAVDNSVDISPIESRLGAMEVEISRLADKKPAVVEIEQPEMPAKLDLKVVGRDSNGDIKDVEVQVVRA